MQLSVIIPEYNYDCTKLVSDLRQSCEAAYGLSSYEILVIDDGSTNTETLETNKAIDKWPGCQFIRKTANTGLANTRNEGIKRSSGEFVVIIDCDAKVHNSDFIAHYMEAARQEKDNEFVICGSILTTPEYSRPDNQLRYRYEVAANRIRDIKYRQAHPYNSFTAFNVLISRDVFSRLVFEDIISQYGYEDTLFGMQLQKLGIPVHHIDNPLIHTGINSNEDFLHNTEQALQNLNTHARLFPQGTPITRTVERMRRLRLLPFVKMWHKWFAGLERRNLLGKNPSLLVFKLYKLGYFAQLRH